MDVGAAGERVVLHGGADIAAVRDAVRRLTLQLGFGELRRTHAVTAASELARNVLVHGRGGEATLEVTATERGPALRMTFVDRGPGIADLHLAMRPGWSSGGGMGLGLPGARRLVDAIDVRSRDGGGLRVEAVMWA